MIRHAIGALFFAAAGFAAQPAPALWAASNPDWGEAFKRFRMEDGACFVGTRGPSRFLITTEGRQREFLGLERRARRITGDEDAFVIPGSFPASMEKLEAAFNETRAAQMAAPATE